MTMFKSSAKQLSTALFAAGLSLSAANSNAWTYALGDYNSNYSYSGIPLSMADDVAVSSELLNKIGTALPNGRNVTLTNPDYITNDAGANITVKETGEVFITFLHEGAGYRNGFGYFTYTGDEPTSRDDINEIVLMPNASFFNSGGDSNGMRVGDTISLGTHTAGTKIGFFVVANGFYPNYGIKPWQNEDWIFYTVKDLNAETDDELKAHTVMLFDDESGNIVLGLEDILRTTSGCDHDFNDVIFMVSSNPETAIDKSTITVLPENEDTDGDGVLDGNDDYPNDSERAFDVYYPSADGLGTLAFEDNWPVEGDYDLNDLVVAYRYKETRNSLGRIKDIHVDYTFTARGASRSNGFALALNNILATTTYTASRTVNGGDSETIVSDEQSSHLNFVVVQNTETLMPTPPGCQFYNTDADCPISPEIPASLSITFDVAKTRSQTGNAPYNPYIFATFDRGREVHLPNHRPSARADQNRFGSGDDDSNLFDFSKTYETATNLPWALNMPYSWLHPTSGDNIVDVYNDYRQWAESGGLTSTDWYTKNYNSNRVYIGE
ncbi:MAG: LruC domain-containing protein [Saccharospirillaceae bacterium]|nr:LruC domain-containing protein [Saccharospirillaceae bacterium]